MEVFASFFNDQIRPQEETRQFAYLSISDLIATRTKGHLLRSCGQPSFSCELFARVCYSRLISHVLLDERKPAMAATTCDGTLLLPPGFGPVGVLGANGSQVGEVRFHFLHFREAWSNAERPKHLPFQW